MGRSPITYVQQTLRQMLKRSYIGIHRVSRVCTDPVRLSRRYSIYEGHIYACVFRSSAGIKGMF